MRPWIGFLFLFGAACASPQAEPIARPNGVASPSRLASPVVATPDLESGDFEPLPLETDTSDEATDVLHESEAEFSLCQWEGRTARSCEVLGPTPDEHVLEVHEWGAGAKRVYLIGGIHGNEDEGQNLVEQLGMVLEDEARLRGVTLRVLRDLNPDGLSKGSRYNSSGVDLNRNWPADNFRPSARNGRAPLSEVEVSLAHADMQAFDPDVIVVFHSSARGPFVNFDGPAESLAMAFARGAYTRDPAWKVVADMGYPTPGSLGSYWGVDQGLPVLTIEFRRGQEPGTALEAGRAGLLELLRELSFPTLASHR